MIIDAEVKHSVQKFYDHCKWDESIYTDNDIVVEMPKMLGDIFESVVAAVLIDSGSIEITCVIFGYFFCNFILFMVKNKEKYKKRVIARLCEVVTGRGDKIDFQEFLVDDVFLVRVFINEKFVHEEYGDSIKNAKDKACLATFDMINKTDLA